MCNNGHTKFNDQWLWKNYGQPTGIFVHYMNGQWVILKSMRIGASPGSAITAIDGKSIEEFFAEKSVYISGSDELAKRNHLFNTGYLFNPSFSISLSDGQTVRIDRSANGVRVAGAQNHIPPMPDGVAYTAVNSFEDAKYQDDTLSFVKTHLDAKTIIIDVRGNNGGTTPSKLIEAFVTKPYVDWSSMSAMSVGLLKAYADYLPQVDAKSDPENHGYMEAMDDFFHRPMMFFPGGLQKPNNPIYKGRLIVLIDADCASACEDFIMPLKVTHRATLIGTRTFGSSGMPFRRQLSDDMSYTVGARRMYFGDGAPFEGVGINPDIEVSPTLVELQQGRDSVLAKAIKLATQ